MIYGKRLACVAERNNGPMSDLPTFDITAQLHLLNQSHGVIFPQRASLQVLHSLQTSQYIFYLVMDEIAPEYDVVVLGTGWSSSTIHLCFRPKLID